MKVIRKVPKDSYGCISMEDPNPKFNSVAMQMHGLYTHTFTTSFMLPYIYVIRSSLPHNEEVNGCIYWYVRVYRYATTMPILDRMHFYQKDMYI